MHTSGGGALNSVAYVAMLYIVIFSTRSVFGDVGQWVHSTPLHRIVRPWAVVLWLPVAIPSLYELAHHSIYDTLSRQPDRIKDHHEYYRLLTAACVQDGKLSGTLFNIVTLAIILVLAVQLWGPARTTFLYVVGIIVFNLSATYLSPSAGGGNSGLTFFLATSIVGLLLVRHRTWEPVVAAVAITGIGVALLVARDAHSEPILIGLLVLGPLFAAVAGPRRISTPRPTTSPRPPARTRALQHHR